MIKKLIIFSICIGAVLFSGCRTMTKVEFDAYIKREFDGDIEKYNAAMRKISEMNVEQNKRAQQAQTQAQTASINPGGNSFVPPPVP